MPVKERLFRFNPFTISKWSDEEVKEQYGVLEESLSYGDTPGELANDIDVYANMGYLVGEMVARYYEVVSIDEAKLKVALANEIYRERNNWSKTNDAKTPAMSYFEAKAQSKYLDEYSDLYRKEANYKRFKIAYDSIQDKQNALKKKLEAVRFEIGN